MDGFRSLEIGERVRFQIRQRKEGLEAANVTGAEADGHLKGSSIRPLGKNKASFIRFVTNKFHSFYIRERENWGTC
ncbi:unnamed protein product [Toxocara canis]|uniref:CSD domain-containing protein n=1 Tax=Toxocara canis TaxID=6265 RepID=A0A183U9U8_TOXCA|nr:unnamed protein product [Toxocara canis]